MRCQYSHRRKCVRGSFFSSCCSHLSVPVDVCLSCLQEDGVLEPECDVRYFCWSCQHVCCEQCVVTGESDSIPADAIDTDSDLTDLTDLTDSGSDLTDSGSNPDPDFPDKKKRVYCACGCLFDTLSAVTPGICRECDTLSIVETNCCECPDTVWESVGYMCGVHLVQALAASSRKKGRPYICGCVSTDPSKATYRCGTCAKTHATPCRHCGDIPTRNHEPFPTPPPPTPHSHPW